MGTYLNNIGLYATNAGDLVTAREYLPMTVGHAGDMGGLSVRLRNLANCLAYLGELSAAWDAAAEAFACAGSSEIHISRSHMVLGRLAGLMGDAAQAADQFTAADQIEFGAEPDGDHLHALGGIVWAEWLVHTERLGPAQALTDRNLEICQEYGWNENAALCHRLLGRIALAAGDTAEAGQHSAAAAGCFRVGDLLIELAITLADQAGQAQAAGDLAAADRHVAEAITIAGPRGLVPAQSAALAARARIRASQAEAAAATAGSDYLAQGRDAADAALRLATRHQLAWHEFDAVRAHAALDHAEGTDHGWEAQADALHARLMPPGLDPDPLGTVERLVAAQRKGGAKSHRSQPGPKR